MVFVFLSCVLLTCSQVVSMLWNEKKTSMFFCLVSHHFQNNIFLHVSLLVYIRFLNVAFMLSSSKFYDNLLGATQYHFGLLGYARDIL